MDSGTLLRDARQRHGVDQRGLARRARTTQAQISRIERGEVSPRVDTLRRLLQALGERLELSSEQGPIGNQPRGELRADYELLSPGERVLHAAELSFALTSIAAGVRRG